ncbi:hypothetical protein V5O48_013212 [Marasmius crinis-equi]|uniref:Uncharacterized protein n=1 Tax=Marasmius crinis-equi TaxID=585013 RepID=A0ABR3F0P5_9AGAR
MFNGPKVEKQDSPIGNSSLFSTSGNHDTKATAPATAPPPQNQQGGSNQGNSRPPSGLGGGGGGGPPEDGGGGGGSNGGGDGDPNRRWGPPIGGGGGPPRGSAPPNDGRGGGGPGGPPGGGGGPPGGPPGGDGDGDGGHDPVRRPWRDPWDDQNRAREATPFGELPPDGPALTEEFFEYKPPEYEGSELALRERVFTLTATYVAYTLYSKQPISGDTRNISKMLTNALAPLDPYEGQRNVILFDGFVKGLARLCVAHGLTGPPRILDQYGRWVVTAEDTLRTITLGGQLQGSAKHWYNTVVERVPAGFRIGQDASRYRPSFMEVLRGLFDRFISNAALYDLSKEFKKVRYDLKGGARQLFADLYNCATRMPSPPTVYDFKVAITERLPRPIIRHAAFNGVTPETATVDDIMQKALMLEQGIEATQFYSSTLQDTGATPKKLQVVAQVRHQVEDHAKMREVEQNRQTKWNAGFKQRQEDRRQAPARNNPTPNASRAPKQLRVSRMGPDGSCWGCGKFGHYMNDPNCPKRSSGVQFARVLEDHEPSDETTFVISIGGDEDPAEEDTPPEQEDGDPYATRMFDDEMDEDDLGLETKNAYMFEQTYAISGGSTGRGHAILSTIQEPPYIDEDNAEFPHEEGVMDYGEYWRSIQEIPGEEGCFAATVEPTWSKTLKMGSRPRREFAENRCLAAWVSINGIQCFTLFDTGSTADIISPDIATVANVDIFQLRNPVILQLGTKGSRSKINYGCEAEFSFGNEKKMVKGRTYVDVANIDRYDMVIGCAFMRRHGMSVDLKYDRITVDGTPIPTIPAEEEQQELIRRAAKRVVDSKDTDRSTTMREYEVRTFEHYERFERARKDIVEEGMPIGERPVSTTAEEATYSTDTTRTRVVGDEKEETE